MKKILCLFSALTLVLTSCSNEDSASDSAPVTLLKKTVDTYSDGSTLTTNFNYNGNKFVSAINDSGEGNVYWTYTGDLITKMEFKLDDGTLVQKNTFVYDSNNKLVSFVRIEVADKLGFKETYVYNTDGSISVNAYSGDDKTQTTVNGTGTVTFHGGEVSKIVSTYGVTHTYLYDAKNNPFKNVLGCNKIAFVDGEAEGVLHNVISETNGDVLNFSSVFTYNAEGFPLTCIEASLSEVISTEFFY